nr:FAD-dependent oxidoreductase [Paracoccus sp. S-4012]
MPDRGRPAGRGAADGSGLRDRRRGRDGRLDRTGGKGVTEAIYQVAIVGAGPGGLAAARECAAAGARAVVIDEQEAPGGQIFRQAPRGFSAGAERFGAGYVEGVVAANETRALTGIDWRPDTSVWGLLTPGQSGSDHFRLATTSSTGLDEIVAERLILATGCYDMPVPFPGWTLPGVMGAGAVQAFMKSQRVLPGERVVLAGSHPLLLIVADQMLAFGKPPVAVIFSQRKSRVFAMLRRPLTGLGFSRLLMQAAAALGRLLRAGVPIRFGSAVVAAQGRDGVETARVSRISGDGRPEGAEERVGCDTVGIGYGFTASAELARLAGAEMRWAPWQGGWVVAHDDGMRASVPALHVAGEIAGIGGAHTAVAEGRLAALTALGDLGLTVSAPDLRRARRASAQCRRFAALLAELSTPPEGLLRSLQGPDTIICRCEGTTRGEIGATLGGNPFLGTSDAVKLLARPGMGACQARYCGRSLAEITAEVTGRSLEEVGPPRVRTPVKPVPLSHFRLPDA